VVQVPVDGLRLQHPAPVPLAAVLVDPLDSVRVVAEEVEHPAAVQVVLVLEEAAGGVGEEVDAEDAHRLIVEPCLVPRVDAWPPVASLDLLVEGAESEDLRVALRARFWNAALGVFDLDLRATAGRRGAGPAAVTV